MYKLNIKTIRYAILCLCIFLIFPCFIYADEILKTEELSKLTFEELINVKIAVPAALTHLTRAETPAAVTIITAEDIKYTPARNIYDLIEVYVPGALWMNYENGPQLGTRGIISNRNNKYLLRVNGKTINNKADFGAMSELEQWNLSDIQQIEIIRGPGSVTYGPGAIAGVINIKTHNANSSPGTNINSHYLDKYDSKSFSLSHGYISPDLNVYGFASITRTKGFKPNHFLVNKNNEAGYIGETIELGSEPLDYFADYNDNPQMKFFISVDFKKHWSLSARYSQQGSTWRGNEVKADLNGELLNLQSVRNRHFSTTLNFNKKINNTTRLSSMLSMSTSDAFRRGGKLRVPDPNHILNKKRDFGEDEIFFNSVINWKISERTEIAFGTEIIHNQFGPGWGKSEDDMRLGDNGIIISGPNSNAILAGNKGSADKDSSAIFVGSGWSTNTYSFFSEVNIELQPKLKLLLSARVDKNEYTDWLFSPRIAFIANVSHGHYLKFIAQNSIRMNSYSQLFTENNKGIETNTESIKGFEIIYTAFINDSLSINITGFRNDLDVIGWDGENNITLPVGDLHLYGIESEIKYNSSIGKIGASYSFVKQTSWKLAPGVTRSGVSYADYNEPIGDGIQTGVGNDLANWANHAFKIYCRTSLSDKMILNIDSRIFGEYQGMKDGLAGLSQALNGTVDEAAVENALQGVEDAKTYQFDFRLNASLSYNILNNFEIQIYGYNIFGANNNKRYSYDNGNDDPAPTGVRFIEEPRVFGSRLYYSF